MITAHLRQNLGSRHARALREKSLIPGVLYGAQTPSTPVTIPKAALLALYRDRQGSFSNSLVSLQLEGKTHAVLPRHFALDPLKPDEPLSVNWLVYDPEKGARVHLPVLLQDQDKCVALRRGGLANVVLWFVPVLVRGPRIPTCVPVSLAGLVVGDKVTWSKIRFPPEYQVRPDAGLGPDPALVTILGSNARADKAADDAAAASSSSAAAASTSAGTSE